MATVDIKVVSVGAKFQAEILVQGFARQLDEKEFYRGPVRDSYTDAMIDGANVIEMLREKFPQFKQTVTGAGAGTA